MFIVVHFLISIVYRLPNASFQSRWCALSYSSNNTAILPYRGFKISQHWLAIRYWWGTRCTDFRNECFVNFVLRCIPFTQFGSQPTWGSTIFEVVLSTHNSPIYNITVNPHFIGSDHNLIVLKCRLGNSVLITNF